MSICCYLQGILKDVLGRVLRAWDSGAQDVKFRIWCGGKKADDFQNAYTSTLKQ